ncbi:dynein light chain Tctex-type protein 2-like [Prorops nasuta]|uniref:dynein light chain Tctex-type protein 2-like n=1 Tax=Prorops nasuta TaxID=863751 RepID=UPI0034CF8B77
MPLLHEVVDKTNHSGNEVANYQNSYRLEPHNIFRVDAVDKIVQAVMIDNLCDVIYDPMESPNLCIKVATDIRKRILKLNFERHKIIVLVTIIERASQSFESLVGYLWDAERDNYSIFTYETKTLFSSCCVFGVYFE